MTENPWKTYNITAESGTEFTHFSKLTSLSEAQAEWERKFNQKAYKISVEPDDEELDFDWIVVEE